MRVPPLFVRDNTVCSAGTEFYTCAQSGYKGCCSVDACDFPNGCPDSSSATKPAPTSSTGPTSPPTSSSPTSSSKTTASKTGSSVTPSHTGDSTPTNTGSKTSSAPPTGSPTTPSGDGNQGSSSHSLSKGAIGGIVTAGVLVFVVLIGLYLWNMHRRNQLLQQQAALAAAGGQSDQQQPPPISTLAQQTPSPAINMSGSPPVDEKCGVGQHESFLSDGSSSTNVNGFNNGGSNGLNGNKLAEMYATPTSSNAPLFGEAPEGDLEASIARWGLHGARLAAQRRNQQQGLVRSQSDVADVGGSYMGPGAEPNGGAPPVDPPVDPRIAELDGQRTSVVAELETPLPTPLPTPMSTPGLGSYSPSLSAMSSQAGGRSTIVSSWRNSSRTVGSSSDVIAEEEAQYRASLPATPELAGTPRIPDPAAAAGSGAGAGAVSPPPPPHSPTRSGSTTESPRATLDVSQTERVRGVHVTSWGSYQQ